MSDVAVVLRKARDLYAANPSHCDPWNFPAPGSFCPLSAVYKVMGVNYSHHVIEALRSAVGIQRKSVSIPEWNAKNSTETVLAAFDKAITEADNA